ncbi:hypothetical protein WOLCODRAFT_147112 [Wolfiporia cocos MD-104 SS10]|uniref:Uncharacterized protein n=1 Tax=Wolfiporia cocos (strain MD-104) TaxID=742152 RepID=A0A2H3ISN9_WOLCO|nr:hypothetical protein WOLCODRAFT_147112 [Wolfiporia cocos MD-104 SS10]
MGGKERQKRGREAEFKLAGIGTNNLACGATRRDAAPPPRDDIDVDLPLDMDDTRSPAVSGLAGELHSIQTSHGDAEGHPHLSFAVLSDEVEDLWDDLAHEEMDRAVMSKLNMYGVTADWEERGPRAFVPAWVLETVVLALKENFNLIFSTV